MQCGAFAGNAEGALPHERLRTVEVAEFRISAISEAIIVGNASPNVDDTSQFLGSRNDYDLTSCFRSRRQRQSLVAPCLQHKPDFVRVHLVRPKQILAASPLQRSRILRW